MLMLGALAAVVVIAIVAAVLLTRRKKGLEQVQPAQTISGEAAAIRQGHLGPEEAAPEVPCGTVYRPDAPPPGR
jgi:hypothetical protein